MNMPAQSTDFARLRGFPGLAGNLVELAA